MVRRGGGAGEGAMKGRTGHAGRRALEGKKADGEDRELIEKGAGVFLYVLGGVVREEGRHGHVRCSRRRR